jgi:hypothetical protein
VLLKLLSKENNLFWKLCTPTFFKATLRKG